MDWYIAQIVLVFGCLGILLLQKVLRIADFFVWESEAKCWSVEKLTSKGLASYGQESVQADEMPESPR